MSAAENQSQRARRFLELHRGPGILRLPNAWDAASARVFEDAGFPAIGTTSAGVAFSLGFSDGEHVPFAEALRVIARIVAAVRVPVSADIESGFGPTPEEVARSCRAVIEAGAVGVNLEDGSADPDHPLTDAGLHAEKIRAARQAAASARAGLVVNARTDSYLRAVGTVETRFSETVRRSNAYRQAGADCLFVPGVADGATIQRLVAEIDGPVNILAGPSTPAAAELEKMGVARVSLGSGPMRATMGLLRSIARELAREGTITRLLAESIPYAEANALFGAR